jgi:twitching motility protein PilU
MQSFDQAIMDLYSRNLISIDEALANATSPNDMRLRLRLQDNISISTKEN